MNASDLGRKIKEARLAKKMTQAEVVGNFITRNMLSQIESGNAMPSIKTLTYLASVLDLPLNQLLGSAVATVSPTQFLQTVKQDLRDGHYEAVIAACVSGLPAIADELDALAARACLARARELAADSPLEVVTDLVQRSIDYAGQGLYANESLKSEALLFLSQHTAQQEACPVEMPPCSDQKNS